MRLAWRLLACTTILVTGCSVTSIAPSSPDPVPAVSVPLSGVIHGGQQAIKQASVYMFRVHTGSYGTASDSLLSNTGFTDGSRSYVQTDNNGIFHITSTEYTCNAGDQVYLYSVGGDAGFGTNIHAGLMAVLGQCGTGSSFTGLPGTIQMNEVTTVAAAYALAGFAVDATTMSGNSGQTTMGKTGLANAAATAGILANLSGQALTPGDSNGTTVQEQINTLANILAACINTNGAVTGPTNPTGCYTLFTNSLSGGTTGSQPGDTATAAINIVHNPGVSRPIAFFNLAPAQSVFQPNLSGGPNDWTLAITYTGGGLNGATDIAIDSTGSVYVTNSDNDTVTKYTPFGVVDSHSPFTMNGLGNPFGLAIDASDNVWVVNWNTSEISGFTSTGGVVANSPFSGNGIGDPFWIAFDSSGNLWVSNFGNNTISEFSSSGTPLFNSPTNSGGLNGPDGLCIGNGTSADIWVTNPDGVSGTTVSRFTSTGAPYSSGYTATGMVGPIKCAIDANGRVWTSNYGGASSTSSGISRLDSNGANGVTYTGGGSNGTYGGSYAIAIDGADHVWVANYGPSEASNTGSITELDNSGNAISDVNGFQPKLNKPDSIAIDGSGNVWVVNNGDPSVTELVGAATPVITPLAVASKAGKLGQAP